jgi:cysteine desulfurase
MNGHPDTEALSAFLDGEAPEVESHVAACGECRHRLDALGQARTAVAALINADPSEVVFTSGGTEADNFAIRGAAEAIEPTGRKHLIASAIEHEAVLTTLKTLERRGWQVTLLSPGRSGVLDPNVLQAAMRPDTALVSVMHANNEVGTIQPIADLSAIAHAQGALFHTDAVQSVGKIPVSVRGLGVDLLSLAGHKFGGPKGTGALWMRRGVRLTAFMTGGRQERNRRAGTENVPALVGLGVAAAAVRHSLSANAQKVGALRDRFESAVLASIPGTTINGDRASTPASCSFCSTLADAEGSSGISVGSEAG